MSRIYNIYENKMDRTWYKSSNIKYSECDDNVNALKTVRIVFEDGRTYQYNDVDVNDYLLFREDLSQGKAINRFLKKYEVIKLENRETKLIEEELEKLTKPIDFTISDEENTIKLNDKNNQLFFTIAKEELYNSPSTVIVNLLNKFNIITKIINNNE